MDNFDFGALIVAFPAAVVMLAWIQDLRGQLKDLRDDHERLHMEYNQHLKNGYNTSIELALKKSFDDQTEMKPQP